MKFSIVTPNYNYGRFLKKALQSVFDQTSSPDISIEHIVIDGGSTDGTVEILKAWDSFVRGTAEAKESRYSFSYVSEPDRGQTDAINKGLCRATGDIVAWLNADEWYLPGKLARVAKEFSRHPRTDFIYGEPLYVDGDGKPIRIKRDHPFSRFVLLYYGCYIASCCSFWRRRIQTEGKIFLDPSYKVTMDYEFYCHICRAGYRFHFLPSIVAAFTWHGGNVSAMMGERLKQEDFAVKLKYASSPFKKATIQGNTHYGLARIGHLYRQLLVLFRLITLPRDHINHVLP